MAAGLSPIARAFTLRRFVAIAIVPVRRCRPPTHLLDQTARLGRPVQRQARYGLADQPGKRPALDLGVSPVRRLAGQELSGPGRDLPPDPARSDLAWLSR